MSLLEKLPGTIKVECTPQLKLEIKNSGITGCFFVMDEIRNISGVVDVWPADDQKIDLVVEVEVDTYDQGKEIENQISKIDGVKEAHAYLAVEV